MQNHESQQIVERFFAALQMLKANKVIRGKQTFTRRYGINRWNMNTLEKNPASDMFQVSWLTYLVNDYGVSALWLLTGQGDVFLKNRKNDKAVLTISARQGKRQTGRKAPISGEMERSGGGLFGRIPGGLRKVEFRNAAV